MGLGPDVHLIAHFFGVELVIKDPKVALQVTNLIWDHCPGIVQAVQDEVRRSTSSGFPTRSVVVESGLIHALTRQGTLDDEDADEHNDWYSHMDPENRKKR